jgi:transaldolase/glucose-6-phosphate isomerase
MIKPMQELKGRGQSPWLDDIDRKLLESGELGRMVNEDGIAGLTSNPAIFEKAIGQGLLYGKMMAEVINEGARTPQAIYEEMAIRDIQDAADLLMPVYDATGGADGFVSFEVSPHLAHDAMATVEEAKRLWSRVNRSNLMMKVPGTLQGLLAVRELIEAGISVNVTLLFSTDVYKAARDAYVAGIEARIARGLEVNHVASVASFFVSRIDSAVDEALKNSDSATNLLGKTALANAVLAYADFEHFTNESRWKTCAAKGARPQRLLWASTSTKNPAYRDVMYVEGLVLQHTINTLPLSTFKAFKDHGMPMRSQSYAEAASTMRALAAAGIDFKGITDTLLAQGIELFADAFDRLLKTIASRMADTGGLRA